MVQNSYEFVRQFGKENGIVSIFCTFGIFLIGSFDKVLGNPAFQILQIFHFENVFGELRLRFDNDEQEFGGGNFRNLAGIFLEHFKYGLYEILLEFFVSELAFGLENDRRKVVAKHHVAAPVAAGCVRKVLSNGICSRGVVDVGATVVHENLGENIRYFG